MAHFAEIDENNIVQQVLVVHNNEVEDDEGNDVEQKGIDFCETLFGHPNWVQCSYNNNIRKQFAGTGFTYDSDNDVFIAPQPYDSWSLDENFDWQAPVEKPNDDNIYTWDEENQEWKVQQIGE